MKKISSAVLVSLAVALAASLGAIFVSCGSFTSTPIDYTPGTGGTTGGSGTGGATGTTGTGGSDTPGRPAPAARPAPPAPAARHRHRRHDRHRRPAGRHGRHARRRHRRRDRHRRRAVAASGPCDILAAAGNTCVAAHSTTRLLYSKLHRAALPGLPRSVYAGRAELVPAAPRTIKDIGVVAGGYADAATQDTFCTGATCTISIIYDQSANGNHLRPAPRGGNGPADNPAIATALKTTLNGHPVYGVFIRTGIGVSRRMHQLRVVTPKGTATGDQPETEYMVTSQNGLHRRLLLRLRQRRNRARNDDGNGTMEAVYFGGGVVWGTGSRRRPQQRPVGHGRPRERSLRRVGATNHVNDQKISTNTALHFDFVTARRSSATRRRQNAGRGRFAIYGGDATAGTLKTMYDGIRPAKTGYVPMKKQGSIILGIGGDNSNVAAGTVVRRRHGERRRDDGDRQRRPGQHRRRESTVSSAGRSVMLRQIARSLVLGGCLVSIPVAAQDSRGPENARPRRPPPAQPPAAPPGSGCRLPRVKAEAAATGRPGTRKSTATSERRCPWASAHVRVPTTSTDPTVRARQVDRSEPDPGVVRAESDGRRQLLQLRVHATAGAGLGGVLHPREEEARRRRGRVDGLLVSGGRLPKPDAAWAPGLAYLTLDTDFEARRAQPERRAHGGRVVAEVRLLREVRHLHARALSPDRRTAEADGARWTPDLTVVFTARFRHRPGRQLQLLAPPPFTGP